MMVMNCSRLAFLRLKNTQRINYRYHLMSTHVFVRGIGLFGALGLSEDLEDCPDFMELVLEDGQDTMKLVSAGWGHSAALTTTGKLYIWGRPFEFSTIMRLHTTYLMSGSLGRMISRSSNTSFGDRQSYFPEPVLLQGQFDIQDVSCSAGLTIYLTNEGKIFSFGQNKWLQCGLNTNNKDAHFLQPTQITSIPTAKKVEAGLQHGLALTKTGELFTWGKTDKGRLGVPFEKTQNCFLPKAVSLKHPKTGVSLEVVDISAGFAHSAAITEDGGIYVFGKGMSDKVDPARQGLIRIYEHQLTPRRIDLPDRLRALQIYSSNFQILIVADDGSLWLMGVSDEERDAHAFPLRVETDYIPIDEKPQDQQNYFKFFPEFDFIGGGHNKVCIHSRREFRRVPSPSSSSSTSPHPSSSDADISSSDHANTVYHSFDLMLRDGKAFLNPILVEDLQYIKVSSNFTNPRVLDYSRGWRHELLLIEEAEVPVPTESSKQ